MFTIVNNNMFNGIRLVSVERGYDSLDFALMGQGGGTGAHISVLDNPAVAGVLLSDSEGDCDTVVIDCPPQMGFVTKSCQYPAITNPRNVVCGVSGPQTLALCFVQNGNPPLKRRYKTVNTHPTGSISGFFAGSGKSAFLWYGTPMQQQK